MSQNAVKCPWKKYVLLPENTSVSAGDDCICPAACPNCKSRQAYCLYACFTAKKDSGELPLNAEAYAYTQEEAVRQFPEYVAPDEQTETVVENAVRAEERTEEPVMPAQSYRLPHFEEETGEVVNPKGYTLPVFGAGVVAGETKLSKTACNLEPRKHYNSFELRGEYFTLDGRGGSKNIGDTVCVNRLYRLILETYDLNSVFDGNDPSDRFLWVLDNTLTGEKRTRAIRVLREEELDAAEKFFLLFYGAIFYDKRLPLYWSSRYVPDKLQPVYEDATDFYRKIAEGRDGQFYALHPELALLWLRKLELFDWQDGEKLSEAICKIQDDVAIDPSSEAIVFWSSDKFVGLGLKNEFIDRLTESDKTLVELEYTAEFLSRFDILRQGGQYRIVKRGAPDGRHLVDVSDDEINDGVTAMLFSRDRSVNKLEYYLYILKRYCELFKPLSVKTGGLEFDEGSYTEQTERYVIDMCAHVFGDASDDVQKIKAHNDAALAKLLYSKGVLFARSARAARDDSFMNGLLSIVTNGDYPESRVQEYFGFCKKNGIADKITLYSYDRDAVPPKAKMTPVKEWLSKTVRGANGVVDLCSRLRLPVFAAYKAVFGVGDRYVKEADEMFEYFKAKEKSILEMVRKL